MSTGSLDAHIAVPGSKSTTNRALVLAALADGPGLIAGGLDARDTQLMRHALRALGVHIDDASATWHVTPPTALVGGGHIDCGLAGTVMRFVPALAGLAAGSTRFTGDAAASRRPVAPLLDALAQLGAGVDGVAVPFTVTGPMRGGRATVDASASSQFVSALLLAGARLPEGLVLRHVGSSLPSLPHVAMTVAMLAERGVRVDQPDAVTWVVRPGHLAARAEVIEPDLTNAAVFLAAAATAGGRVVVPGWPAATTQAGDAIRGILTGLGADVRQEAGCVSVTGSGRLRGADIDLHAASELTPVVAALACFADQPSRLRGIAHIRGHETDRLAALVAAITGLGGRAEETADGLFIVPTPLHGGLWPCFADHRMAHAGALVGLRVPDVVLDDVGCTRKTLPDFPGLWAALLGSRTPATRRPVQRA